LLFRHSPWVARLVQIVLVLGAAEWAHTLNELVQLRLAQTMPATILAIVLTVIIAMTVTSALVLETQTIKRIYGRL